jgi:aerobic-type carbon monoxide dehydrogenase small subunit (CoxS/CutS family)
VSGRGGIKLKVNGKKRVVHAPPMARLLDVLREDLGLTGTKEGCGEGECGACSVLVDGEVVASCLVPLCQVDGAKVVTIEGLAKKKLHPLQQAFLACGGSQCGICTPGMIVAASTLDEGATLDDVKNALAGNLCRCTGYTKIYDSVLAVVGGRDEKKKARKARKAPRAVEGGR